MIARFEPQTEPPLTLTVNGTGGFGRAHVTSSPGGIDCDFSNPISLAGTGTCSTQFPSGSTVQLTAVPRDGTKVLGFTGDCASTSDTCSVVIYHDRRAVVQLDPARFPVTIVGAGNGTGNLSQSATDTEGSPRIGCGITQGVAAAAGCTTTYPFGSTIQWEVLTPLTGSSSFGGFSAPCVDVSALCSAKVTGPLTITATFKAPAIEVSGAGSGSGRVVGAGANGLDCSVSPSGNSGTCSRVSDVSIATTLAFTATPTAGSVFAGWSGLCSGTGACSTLGGFPPNTQLVARFDLASTPTQTLTVNAIGQGSGAVQSSPAGIACTITNGVIGVSGCSASFTQGQVVTLTAATSSPYRFVGWSGPCDGNAPCVVTMSQAQTVTARFEHDDDAVAVTIVGGGTGNGVVNVSPGSIPCTISGGGVVDGASCTVVFGAPRQIVLTANPQFGSTFVGWSGEGCTTTELQCIFTLTSSRTIVATFISPHSPHDLALALLGTVKLLPGEATALDRLGNKDGAYDIRGPARLSGSHGAKAHCDGCRTGHESFSNPGRFSADDAEGSVMRTRPIPMVGSIPRFVSAVLVAGALGCGGSDVRESPLTPQQTPEQGTLTVNLATPNADDGIMLFTVTGPSILGVTAPAGLEILEAETTPGSPTTSKILLRGNIASGGVARVTIRGSDLGASYTARVQDAAAGASGGYRHRTDLSGYRLTLQR